MPKRSPVIGVIALSMAVADFAVGEEPDGHFDGSRDGVKFVLMPRTPRQIAAFYEGRGFIQPAIERTKRACFLTATIVNERNDVVWLELNRWRFMDSRGRSITRITHRDWSEDWERLSVPLANRATFGWTQLPEVRDLQPGEPVGGNVTIDPPADLFRVEARFHTGADKAGREVIIGLSDIRCPPGYTSRDAP